MLDTIKHKLKHPWGKTKKEEKRKELFEQLTANEEASTKILKLSEDLDVLYQWLQKTFSA